MLIFTIMQQHLMLGVGTLRLDISSTFLVLALLFAAFIITQVTVAFYNVYLSPLSHVPGPRLVRTTVSSYLRTSAHSFTSGQHLASLNYGE